MDIANIVLVSVSCAGDLCILIITIYTFWMNFASKKIKVASFGFSFNTWKSDSINFVLKNKTLRTFPISKIYVVFGGKYRIKIRSYDEPMILKPLESKAISMTEFTKILGTTINELSDVFMETHDAYIEIHNDENQIMYLPVHGKLNKPEKPPMDYTVYSKTFNRITIREEYMYALIIKVGDTIQTEFINKFGHISTDLFEFNAIPTEGIEDVETVANYFKIPCEKYNYGMNIIKLNEESK